MRYAAAVDTAENPSGLCDVCVIEQIICGYQVADDGNEIPQYELGSNVVFGPVETTVRMSDPDSLDRAEEEAKAILAANGWRPASGLTIADNAIYFDVERAGEPSAVANGRGCCPWRPSGWTPPRGFPYSPAARPRTRESARP
jgi:hypothetical protein